MTSPNIEAARNLIAETMAARVTWEDGTEYINVKDAAKILADHVQRAEHRGAERERGEIARTLMSQRSDGEVLSWAAGFVRGYELTRCACGSRATYSLNPAEAVVHRPDGPCHIAPSDGEVAR